MAVNDDYLIDTLMNMGAVDGAQVEAARPAAEAANAGLVDTLIVQKVLNPDRIVLGVESERARETLEEVGVAVGTGDSVLAARLVEGRRDLEAGRIGLVDLVRESGTSLDLSGIHAVARWVTPMPSIKRYDTYFFVATVDPNVQPEVDGREAVHAEWCRPADVLERWRAGELTMISPTISMFQRLASHVSATGVLSAAEAGGPVLRARILDDSTTPVRFEGDPGFNEPGTRESLGWVWLPAGDRPDPTTGWA